MANDKNPFGSIDVAMGDGNTVGHIGHKITFHAPPPPPNGMYQHGRLIGQFAEEPAQSGNYYCFSKLFVSEAFDRSAVFEIQGVKLMLERMDAETRASRGGRPAEITLWRAVCRILP